MRKTLTLTVDNDLAEFIRNQQGLVDPSALMNKLIHEEIRRQGVQVDPERISRLQNDEVSQTLELFMDENTPAAD